MKTHKHWWRTVAAAVACVALASCSGKDSGAKDSVQVVPVQRGDLRVEVSATGTVQPQNRLEIKPTQGGRMDEILVREGDRVKAGQVLCRMSSTERAALIDAASTQGTNETQYWSEVYKPSPLIAPIDGEVIVRAVEPGQSVSAGTAVLVLSDRLIIVARVDETDIGRVQTGQVARIDLDAYPDVRVRGHVDHISFESKTVNNVTVYEVEVVPDKVPSVFRSGMSATVSITAMSRTAVLQVPREAIQQNGTDTWVMVREPGARAEVRRPVQLGLLTDQMAEVTQGLVEGDTVTVRRQGLSAAMTAKPQASPFMPQPGRAGGAARGQHR